MHQLDLVISVDTSTVHLAGALGLPVWMLARPDYEWRWGDRGESTPWYRSLRIFRHAPGTFDQDAQVARTAQALREWAAT
jgi:ADP-heptose:LPS heptosyltransferase